MTTAFDPARIRALREQRAWSQEQLAEVAGISVRTIQRAETSGNASAETRMALAAALDVPLQAFAPQAAAQEQAPVAPTAELARHARNLVVVGWTLIGLLFVFGYASCAYRVGADLAESENASRCKTEPASCPLTRGDAANP